MSTKNGYVLGRKQICGAEYQILLAGTQVTVGLWVYSYACQLKHYLTYHLHNNVSTVKTPLTIL